MLAVGEKNAPAELRDRLSFTQANFFTAQQYKGAAAYLIRQCTHNWADHDVVTMLKAIVPGLEGSAPGTPLLINDMIMPEPGAKDVPRVWERERRQAGGYGHAGVLWRQAADYFGASGAAQGGGPEVCHPQGAC